MRTPVAAVLCIMVSSALWPATPSLGQSAPLEQGRSAEAKTPKRALRSSTPPAAGATVPNGLRVDQELSQTSVWPGDRFEYRLTISAPPDLKLSVEDLSGRSTMFTPFVLVDLKSWTEDRPGARLYVFDYTLASYEIGDGVVQIPAQAFRYQPTSATASPRQISDIRVPAMPIATRSTLNQAIGDATIRAFLPRPFRPQQQATLWAAAGAAGLLFTSLPLFVWTARLVRRRLQQPRVSHRRTRREAARGLQQVAAMAITGTEELKDAYRALERVGQHFIGTSWTGVAAADALTDVDFARVGPSAGVPVQVREVLSAVFANSQKCRYSKPDVEAWRQRFEADLSAVRDLVGAKRR